MPLSPQRLAVIKKAWATLKRPNFDDIEKPNLSNLRAKIRLAAPTGGRRYYTPQMIHDTAASSRLTGQAAVDANPKIAELVRRYHRCCKEIEQIDKALEKHGLEISEGPGSILEDNVTIDGDTYELEAERVPYPNWEEERKLRKEISETLLESLPEAKSLEALVALARLIYNDEVIHSALTYVRPGSQEATEKAKKTIPSTKFFKSMGIKVEEPPIENFKPAKKGLTL